MNDILDENGKHYPGIIVRDTPSVNAGGDIAPLNPAIPRLGHAAYIKNHRRGRSL
jgi:hypothetical protein